MTAPASRLHAAGTVSIAARLVLILIRGYQLTLSAFLGRQCRFAPSCSDYAAEAVRTHGALRGGWLGLRRIGRCHPWGGSGYDPVPTRDATPAPNGVGPQIPTDRPTDHRPTDHRPGIRD